MRNRKNEIDYELTSGNVFADLGLPDPETARVKAKLANAIAELIDGRRLTQGETAELLGATHAVWSRTRPP